MLLHTAAESWTQQRTPYYDSKTDSKATKMITRLIFLLRFPGSFVADILIYTGEVSQ